MNNIIIKNNPIIIIKLKTFSLFNLVKSTHWGPLSSQEWQNAWVFTISNLQRIKLISLIEKLYKIANLTTLRIE